MARGEEGQEDRGHSRAVQAKPANANAVPPVTLSQNPFYAGWAVAAAIGRLVPKGAVRWLGRDGARMPVGRAWRLGRIPLPHLAALSHDHCFAGHPDLRDGQRDRFAAMLQMAGQTSAASPLLSLRRVPGDDPVHDALRAVPGAVILQTRTRAMLDGTADYDAYIESALRGKKRKELRRLRARLEDEGDVAEALFGPDDDLAAWTQDFLRLEALGWKGEAGTAMAKRDAERAYLTLLLEGARDAGALRLFKLSLDGRAIAMVIGLMGADGGLYTYKIAHDPAWDRFSPGVMIILAVTRYVLRTPEVAFADSCAKEGHRMIEQLWRERRTLHDWAVPTSAVGRVVTAALIRLGKARRP